MHLGDRRRGHGLFVEARKHLGNRSAKLFFDARHRELGVERWNLILQLGQFVGDVHR